MEGGREGKKRRGGEGEGEEGREASGRIKLIEEHFQDIICTITN